VPENAGSAAKAGPPTTNRSPRATPKTGKLKKVECREVCSRGTDRTEEGNTDEIIDVLYNTARIESRGYESVLRHIGDPSFTHL